MAIVVDTGPIVTNNRLARDLDGAFPELIAEFQDGIYSGVRRLVPTHADAEDITQETFVRAYRALRGYSEDRVRSLNTAGWLWTIALNLCRNAARTRKRKPPAGPLDTAPDPADGADTAAAAVATLAESEWERRLAQLSETARTAVVLRHVVGLAYREISEATGRPTGTVKADVHRGLRRLRDILAAEPGEQR